MSEKQTLKIAQLRTDEWRVKAMENVDKWGLQDIETLMLAVDEEWGEFIQEYHEGTWEDSSGNPLDEQRDLSDLSGPEIGELEEELSDCAALLIQIQAAIDRAHHHE